jgi:hypothetical protein
MSAPSTKHEVRVATLDTLAQLAGFSRPASIPGLRPDVARRRPPSWLFLGDAKHCERPQDVRTRSRLDRYVRHAAHHIDRGGSLLLALCVPSDGRAWHRLLRSLLARSSCRPDRAGTLITASGELLVWTACGKITRRGPSSTVSSGRWAIIETTNAHITPSTYSAEQGD